MSVWPKTRFTAHGILRVVGGDGEKRRLRLSPGEVAEILDNDKAVPVGRDPKDAHKIHRAFYSIPDGDCFVAVQDDLNGEVITILPFSHHGRFFVDTVRVREMAMELMGIEPQASRPPPIVAGPHTHAVIAMEVRRPTEYQNEIKTTRLMRFPVAEGSLLNEMHKHETLRQEIETKCILGLRYHPRGTEIVRIKVYFVSAGEVSAPHYFEKSEALGT